MKHSWDIANFVIEGKRPNVDPMCPMVYAQIMQRCWAQSPTDRPTFTQAVEELETLIECVSSDEED